MTMKHLDKALLELELDSYDLCEYEEVIERFQVLIGVISLK